MAPKKSTGNQPAKSGPKKSEGPGLLRNLQAVDETITVLIDGGKLEWGADTATIQAARNLAIAVDESPGNANLWRQYREAVSVLYVDDSAASSADELARLLGSLSPTILNETET